LFCRLFVYALPRLSPDGLWTVSQRANLQIDVVAEFRRREDSKFFGSPATVYRIRRGERPESADKTDGLYLPVGESLQRRTE